VDGIPLISRHGIKVGLLHKVSKFGPKVMSSVEPSASIGVIIRNAPSSSGVEHEVSSRSTCLVDSEMQKVGGGRIDKVFPKCDKHVSHVIGSQVHSIKRNCLRAHIAKVCLFVRGPMDVMEKQLGVWVASMCGFLKE